MSADLEAEAGWRAGLDVTVEGSAGLSGGGQEGTALQGMALGYVEWEQARTADSAPHFQACASVLKLAGSGPTESFLGDFLAASNLEGHSSVRLYSWWIGAEQGEWSVRAGALLADDEFTGTEAGGYFFNSAFGWPAFISANTVNTGPAFYVAAPGVRVEHRWGETAAWRIGLYDGDAFDSAEGDPSITRHGLHYRLGGDQGWFLVSEAVFAPAAGATSYKVGAWLHTAKFADVRDDTAGLRLADTGGEPLVHNGNYGAYAAIERTLAGKSGEAGHLTAFVRGGMAPPDRNTLSWSLDTGLACTGLLPGRASDVTALGVVYARFSPHYSANAFAADPSSPRPDFEQVIELTHSVVLSEHVTLQPDLQYIRHPGGSNAWHDALVFLVRVNASF